MCKETKMKRKKSSRYEDSIDIETEEHKKEEDSFWNPTDNYEEEND